MKLVYISLISFALVHGVQATEIHNNCEDALTAANLSAESWKKVVVKQQELIKLTEEQRDRVYGQLEKQGNQYPWYFWAIIGGAAGVVMTRGLR